MGRAIDPAGFISVIPIRAEAEVMCVAFDVLGRRAIGVNEDYLSTSRWHAVVEHAKRHLRRGVDVFVICGPDCSGESV